MNFNGLYIANGYVLTMLLRTFTKVFHHLILLWQCVNVAGFVRLRLRKGLQKIAVLDLWPPPAGWPIEKLLRRLRENEKKSWSAAANAADRPSSES